MFFQGTEGSQKICIPRHQRHLANDLFITFCKSLKVYGFISFLPDVSCRLEVLTMIIQTQLFV